MPLEPNAVATSLIEFARRGAVGAVAVGELTLTFDKSRRVVAARGGDTNFVDFLVRAALLTPPEAREFGAGESDELLIALREKLGGSAVRRARRATWIDRLVKVLGESHRPVPTPLGPTSRAFPGEALVPLVLDALTRRAGHRDAGIVGSHADLHFVWAHGDPTDLAEARRWLTYDPPIDASVSRLLVGHPGAAPRLAALIRAGFARLLSADDAQSAAAPPLPDLGRSSLAPARAPIRQLTPGASVPPPRPEPAFLPEFGTQTAPSIDDPLFALEARITFLEAMDAPGPDRAEAWAAAGEAWLFKHGALDEATRAYRESAAADPTDSSSLLQAAQLCIATGRSSLARAYAASATAVAPDALAGECGRFEARLAILDGDLETAQRLLRDHVEIDQDATEIWASLALLSGDPVLEERARALQGRFNAGPSVLETARNRAHALVESHHPEAAVLTLARAAEQSDDAGVSRTLRFEAAEHAESIERPDLSFPLLLEAFRRDSSLTVLYEPLAHDTEAAGEHALCAALLERFGALTRGADAASWLLRAALAFQRLPSGRAWSHELLARALVASPDSADVLAALVEASDRSRDANVLADALERAAVRASDGAAVPLFERLASLAETRLGSVHRAAWAYRMVHARTGDPAASREAVRLGQKAAVRRSMLELAEEDLASATPEERASAARRLAAMLRDHPEQRARAASLYEECLRSAPDDRSAAQALRRLHALSDDAENRFAALSGQLERAAGTSDRLRLLEELTGLGSLLGKWERVLRDSRTWLTLAPTDRVAVARLTLAATFAGGDAERAEARRARLRLPPRKTHAPLLVEEGNGQRAASDRLDYYERALAIDPRCASALLSRADLEFGSRAEQWRRAEDALALLPTDPQLLARAVDLARTEAPERLDSLRPSDTHTGIRRSPAERFESAAASGDAERAEEALDVWLASEPRPSGSRLVAATKRMATTNLDGAVRMLVRATDQTGDPRYLRAADAVAEGGALTPETHALLLERHVIWDSEITRHLHELADLRADSPSRVARTLVRIIAEDPTDLAAMTRLSKIYASSGEYDRLFAVYALQRDNATGAKARHDAAVAMATLAYRHLKEPARGQAVLADLATDHEGATSAARIMSALGDARGAVELLMNAAGDANPAEASALAVAAVNLAEHAQSGQEATQVAKRALTAGISGADLVLLFERLTLDQAAKDTALDVYEHLRRAAMGAHGRRGIIYRKARWLERFGDEHAALDAYLEAFIESPGDGVILASIERISRRQGRLETWAIALRKLIEQPSSIDVRQRYVLRLTSLYEEDLKQHSDAFESLVSFWEESQKAELVPELQRLALLLQGDEADAALARLVAGLRHRIEETWNSDDQASTLSTLALLHLKLGQNPAKAGAVLAELDALLEEEEDVPRRIGADAFAAVASQLESEDPESARAHAERALGFVADHIPASELLARLGDPASPRSQAPTAAATPKAAATLVEPFPDGARRRPPAVRSYGHSGEAAETVAAEALPDANERARSPLAARYARGDRLDGEEALREAHRAGDLKASSQLADAVAAIEGRGGEAVAILIAALRRSPWESSLYERLAEHASRAGLDAPLRVADEVRAAMAGAPPPADVDDWRRSGRLAPRKELIRGDDHAFLQALALVWEHGGKTLRVTHESVGIVGTERITPLTYGPLGHAAAHAPADLPLFRSPEAGVRIVATEPPSLLIGTSEHDEALAFEVTVRSAQRDAQTLLLCVSPDRSETIVQAVYAAFGPASAAQDVSAGATELMAELWRVVPAQKQSQLRELVAAHGPPNLADLRREAEARGARAGYLSDGRLDRTLRFLGVDWEDFQGSVQANERACAVLRFALSNELLAARTV